MIKEFENNPNVVAVMYNEGGRNGETRAWTETVWNNFYLRGGLIFDELGNNGRLIYNQPNTGLPFGRFFIIDPEGNIALPYFGHDAKKAIGTIYSLLIPPVTGLTVYRTAPDDITLRWNDVGQTVVEYVVYGAPSLTDSFAVVDVTPDTLFIHSGVLQLNDVFFYRVTARRMESR
ncbi:hypothetical protein KKH27_07215 [bacterium]|nr:hypothetical protein [bacterium]MBU1985122.1 hypothetical protein [bacterium]